MRETGITTTTHNGTESILVTAAIGRWLYSLHRQAASMGVCPPPEWFDAGARIISGLGTIQTRELTGENFEQFLATNRSDSDAQGQLMHWMLADFLSFLGNEKLVDYRPDHADLMIASLDIPRPKFTLTAMKLMTSAELLYHSFEMQDHEFQAQPQN